MIQQTTNAQPPRLHPKKRKFDLSELDDPQQPSTLAYVQTSLCNNPVKFSAPPATSSAAYIHHKIADANLNGNGSAYQMAGNFTTVMNQVVRNTNEVQQVIKKQLANSR